MEEKNNKYDNITEFQFLIGKSITGVLYYISLVGLLLIIIGIFCPFCSYNPTLIEEFKRIVKFTELSNIIVLITAIMLVAGLGLFSFSLFSLMKSDWRKKSKMIFVFGIIAAVLLFVAMCIVMYACVDYEIPESDYSHLDIQMEVGFYLFAFGCAVFAGSSLLFCLGLYNLANGKTTLEKLALGKKTENTDVKDIQKVEVSISDKLKELQKLKEDNIITEEEYQSKKEEILKDFK